MLVPFAKMHGCGNDFVVLDGRSQPLALTPSGVVAVADRHIGVGCDQLIVLEPADGADVFMRIWNPDGSEAGACGNATRCVADRLFRETGQNTAIIRTISGDLPASAAAGGQITVDMGPARLDWADIPLAQPMDTLLLDLAADGVAGPAAVSMGNPHATFFVADLAEVAISQIGPALGTRPDLPAARQYRLRPDHRPGDHPTARVGTRRGTDARLRVRRLRRAGECAPARAYQPPRTRHRRRRRIADRMARRRARADDRPGSHRLHRRDRARGLSGMTVELLTFGCRLNAYESEVMRGLAADQDGVVIVNTCAVTGEAERQARQAIRRVARERPDARIVVTGCAAQIDPASLGQAARRAPRAGQ